MTLFKQIIGRGTRLREDLGKTWFTILDFKRATELFADPPSTATRCRSTSPGPGEPVEPRPTHRLTWPPAATQGRHTRADAALTDLDANWPHAPVIPATMAPPNPASTWWAAVVNVAVARERVQYLNADGQLVTESLRDYTRINLGKAATTRWTASCRPGTSADRKAALIAGAGTPGRVPGCAGRRGGQHRPHRPRPLRPAAACGLRPAPADPARTRPAA